MYNIHLLPAAYGDAVLVEYGNGAPKYILIDGGPYYNFEKLVAGLKRVAPKLKELELLVITHIDIDHIDGIVTFLKRDKLPFKIKDIWYNGYDQMDDFRDVLGVLQGEYISSLIQTKGLPHNKSFKRNAVVVTDYKKLPVIKLTGGMTLTLLSPGKMALEKLHAVWKKDIKKYGADPDFVKKIEEDTRYDADDDILGEISIEALQKLKVTGDKAPANGSSIAFIGTFDGRSCLFAADATSDYLLEAINPMLEKSGKERLKLDAWKLAHHASKKSTLEKLMKKIDCKKLLVSTNGAKFSHPDAAAIAKLLKNNGPGLQFYFNYKTEFNERWANAALQNEYKYKAFYPKNISKPGITLKLL
jgi:beta-lactamase superfamily II metal-dependent hydrolase